MSNVLTEKQKNDLKNELIDTVEFYRFSGEYRGDLIGLPTKLVEWTNQYAKDKSLHGLKFVELIDGENLIEEYVALNSNENTIKKDLFNLKQGFFENVASAKKQDPYDYLDQGVYWVRISGKAKVIHKDDIVNEIDNVTNIISVINHMVEKHPEQVVNDIKAFDLSFDNNNNVIKNYSEKMDNLIKETTYEYIDPDDDEEQVVYLSKQLLVKDIQSKLIDNLDNPYNYFVPDFFKLYNEFQDDNESATYHLIDELKDDIDNHFNAKETYEFYQDNRHEIENAAVYNSNLDLFTKDEFLNKLELHDFIDYVVENKDVYALIDTLGLNYSNYMIENPNQQLENKSKFKI